jgi:hypothetical protein
MTPQKRNLTQRRREAKAQRKIVEVCFFIHGVEPQAREVSSINSNELRKLHNLNESG